MEKEYFEILKKFYKKLYDNVIREEKTLESNSILLTLVKVTSNNASKLLNKSSIKSIIFAPNYIKYLEKNDYIRISDNINNFDEYILTAKGLWEIEKNINNLNESTIINFIQNKYLSFSDTSKPLTDTEKIILLSLIGIRNFSSDSPMDLNNNRVRDYWLDIFSGSYSYLLNKNVIKKNSLAFENQGNEHPIAYAMRRANQLPRKTQHIYCFSYENKKRYFLDLINDNGELSIQKLKNLFKLIFKEIDDLKKLDSIHKFCMDIAYEKSKYVKDDFKYIELKYDELIKESLKELYLDQ